MKLLLASVLLVAAQTVVLAQESVGPRMSAALAYQAQLDASLAKPISQPNYQAKQLQELQKINASLESLKVYQPVSISKEQKSCSNPQMFVNPR